MNLEKVLSPSLKTATASSVLRTYQSLYAKPPEKILLLPSSTGYDYQRFTQEWPDAEYWAVERETSTWAAIFATNHYKRVLRSEIRDVDLEGNTFDILYLDLMGYFTNGLITDLMHFLSQGVLAEKGSVVALTLIQRPVRSSEAIRKRMRNMLAWEFADCVTNTFNYSYYAQPDPVQFTTKGVVSYVNHSVFVTSIFHCQKSA